MNPKVFCCLMPVSVWICVTATPMCKPTWLFDFGFLSPWSWASKVFQPPTSHLCVQLLNPCLVAVVSVVTGDVRACWLICCSAGVLFEQIYDFFVLLRRFGIAAFFCICRCKGRVGSENETTNSRQRIYACRSLLICGLKIFTRIVLQIAAPFTLRTDRAVEVMYSHEVDECGA